MYENIEAKLNNEYQLMLYINQLLVDLGNTDSFIRDENAYPKLMNLILNHQLEDEYLIDITERLIQNLFVGIGNKDDDTVFLRSFSLLVLVGIIKRDESLNFLPESLGNDLFNSFFDYFIKEVDIRGYVNEKGWAHSIAHAADLATVLIESRFYEYDYAQFFLFGLKRNLFKLNGDIPYIDDEEERLVFIVDALLNKGLGINELIIWLNDMNDDLLDLKPEGLIYYRTKKNIEGFLKSLYFRVHRYERYDILSEHIEFILRGNFEIDYK